MDKCAAIEPLTCKIESLHNLLNKQNARRAIFSDSSESDSSDESCVDGENCDMDANQDKSFHVKDPVLKLRDSHSNKNNVKENKQTQQYQAPRDPSGSDGPLEDGFTLVRNKKTKTRVFTNSKRYRTHNVTLRAADSSRRENTRRNPEHNRNTKKECEIFVSNLHPEMTCCCLPRPGPLLLYAFRDLWKEWGDSNFQIFTELSLEHFNVFIYILF